MTSGIGASLSWAARRSRSTANSASKASKPACAPDVTGGADDDSVALYVKQLLSYSPWNNGKIDKAGDSERRVLLLDIAENNFDLILYFPGRRSRPINTRLD